MGQGCGGAESVIAARTLATSGQRVASLEMLDRLLDTNPDNTDARVLRATILSWDGDYDAARRDLSTVLAERPGHGDALAALMNVEIWSGHPENAEKIASEALQHEPTNGDLLTARAKALRAMKRSREAMDTVNQALATDPSNHEAGELKHDLEEESRVLELSFTHSSEWFSDGTTPWRGEQIQFSRQSTVGPFIALLVG